MMSCSDPVLFKRLWHRMILLVLSLFGLATGCTFFSNDHELPATLSTLKTEQFDLTTNQPTARVSEPTERPYLLGIGDILSISVYGEDGSGREVPVDPNGNITYVLTGSVNAAGRTIDDLRDDLQARISKRLSRAIITVVPVRFGSQAYTILGEVNYPGTYLIEGQTTILDTIAKARGIRTGYFRNSTAEMADYRHATLMRGGTIIPLDFEALLVKGDARNNVTVQNGDIITIPSSLIKSIYVLGEVNFPRTVGFVSSVSLVQAITEARGIKPTSDGRVVIVQGSLSHPLVKEAHFDEILAGKEPNILLNPGDIVFIPPRQFAFLREIVEKAITAFATTVADESATRVFDKAMGNPSSKDTSRPVIVP